jgi:hypothetical protein
MYVYYMHSILPINPFIIPSVYHQDDWMHNNELSSVQKQCFTKSSENAEYWPSSEIAINVASNKLYMPTIYIVKTYWSLFDLFIST